MKNLEDIKDRLKRVCDYYGVNSEYALFRDNIIIVPDDGNDIYLVFDNNCNILGVERYIKNYAKSIRVTQSTDISSYRFTLFIIRHRKHTS